jgi:predicted DNA-binding protein
MNTKKVHIRMPEELYNLAKIKIPDGNMSAFIREAVQTYVEGGDTKETILQEIHNKEQELCVLRQRLIDIEKTEEIEKSWINKNGYTHAVNAIKRVNNRLGYIGKNQIFQFSKIWHCDKSDLMKYCQENNIVITNYAEYCE